MHDNLDNTIRNRQPMGDETVDLLNSTRPVGSVAHRNELEERLLAQLQSNKERFSNMQAVHSGRLITFRKFPAILAATLTFLIIGGALMLFNLGNGNNLSGAPAGNGSATPTPIQDGCDVHNLQQVAFEIPVDVYSRDDEDAEIIGTVEEGGRIYEILGANLEGDWIVLLWEDNVVGWIHYADLDKDDFIIQYCGQAGVSTVEVQPTIAPPIDLRQVTQYGCDVHNLQQASFAAPVDVYSRDDEDAEIIGTVEAGGRIYEILGANLEGDWIVVLWEDNVEGWIHYADLDFDDFIFQYCGRTEATIVQVPPTMVPPTRPQVTMVPTPTPLTVVDGTPLASPPVLRPFIEAAETLSIYASDDAESEVVQELEEGEIVEVIGQNYDGGWLVVRLNLGFVGWISLEDEDKFTLKEGLIYTNPETGEVRELDATPTEVPTVTPFPQRQNRRTSNNHYFAEAASHGVALIFALSAIQI